jgi:hypothetical protein
MYVEGVGQKSGPYTATLKWSIYRILVDLNRSLTCHSESLRSVPDCTFDM